MQAGAAGKYFTHLSADEQREVSHDVTRFSKDVIYSKRYNDETHEYR